MRTLEERFWAKVQKTDECWLWRASTAGNGYGVISFEGKQQYAHRASWLMHSGLIPEGMNVCHRCDNPPCVRPDHLFLGTQKENLKDGRFKGRVVPRPPGGASLPGESNPCAKLTEGDVLRMRRLYHSVKVTQRTLAQIFGVSWSLVSQIIKRRIWQHV